jgi:5-methyltetrahydrofolate--homocysteine methyltransferase
LPTFVWYFGKQSWFSTQDIIFDLNVFPVATGMEEHRLNALDFFRGTKWVQKIFLIHISGGVSNVSFSFRGNDSEGCIRFSCTMQFKTDDNGESNPEMLSIMTKFKRFIRTRWRCNSKQTRWCKKIVIGLCRKCKRRCKSNEKTIQEWRSNYSETTDPFVGKSDEFIEIDVEEARQQQQNLLDNREINLMAEWCC